MYEYKKYKSTQHSKCDEIIIIIIIIITAIEFSLCGSIPYTSTEKTNNIYKSNTVQTVKKHSK